MNLIEYQNYKNYTNDWVESRPKKGRGQYRKIAQFLNTSTVIVSQIFKGDRELNHDQALALTHYLNFTKVEREYFLTLVQIARAGTHNLKVYLNEKLKVLRKEAGEIKNIIPSDIQISEEDKAKFYSNWYYSGIRLLSSISGHNEIDTISDRFNLPKELVSKVLEFLVEKGLCVKEAGNLRMGPSKTHLESTSPYIKTRSIDWRMKAMERMDHKEESELFLTVPFSISHAGAKKIQDLLNELIKEASKEVSSGKPEELRCLNIDYFKY